MYLKDESTNKVRTAESLGTPKRIGSPRKKTEGDELKSKYDKQTINPA
jgi:hypothetical protein